MEQWISFVQDRWYVVQIALVLLLVVINVVKTVVKWVLAAVIVAGLFLYGGTYVDQIKEAGSQAVGSLRDEALKRLIGQDATYKDNGDGTFTVTAGGVRIDGKKDAGEVKITYLGQSFTVQLEGIVKTVIEQAQAK